MTKERRDKFRTMSLDALRIAAGLMFFSHGLQKLFGWFTERPPVELMSEWGVAGILETFGGFAMIFGVFTQPVALILSGEMAVAYFWKHAGGNDSLWWWENRGELVALYSFIWLLFAARGAGPFSIDALLKKRKSAEA